MLAKCNLSILELNWYLLFGDNKVISRRAKDDNGRKTEKKGIIASARHAKLLFFTVKICDIFVIYDATAATTPQILHI